MEEFYTWLNIVYLQSKLTTQLLRKEISNKVSSLG